MKRVHTRARMLCMSLALLAGCSAMAAAQSVVRGEDSVSIRITATDLQSAVQILARYLERPVLFVGQGGPTVSLETPRLVARQDVIRLLGGLLDGNGFELVDDTASGLYRARPKEAPRPAVVVNPPSVRPRQSEPELFVIALKHARAADVAGTVSSLYGRSASAAAASARPPTLGDELRSTLVPPTGTPPPGEPVRPGRGAELSGEITVVPDPRANTLLIRANRADYELILALVEQIDLRPLQVLIEVVIAEVRRDRSLGIGVEAALGATPVGGSPVSVAGALASEGLSDFALSVMGIGGVEAEATLKLASQRGEVRILSRPVLLATNNQLAEIIVGSQRPFVQVQRALPTDGASRDQVVQYKEVGTKLTVTPSISADGAVHLDVVQEVSNATSETAFDAPVISTRSVSTQLLVQDGQTVTLGGLTDHQRDVTRSGIPVLSSIPIIGGLFGSQQRRVTETELFVFLTPRVIRTDEDAQRVNAPLRERSSRREP